MFLLVSGHHVGAHLDGHQHGVSIPISINLGDILLRIAHGLKIAETWFLARLFILQSSITSQILEFIYWTVTIFSFDHMHMTDENRELSVKSNQAITFVLIWLWFEIGWVMSTGRLYNTHINTNHSIRLEQRNAINLLFPFVLSLSPSSFLFAASTLGRAFFGLLEPNNF